MICSINLPFPLSSANSKLLCIIGKTVFFLLLILLLPFCSVVISTAHVVTMFILMYSFIVKADFSFLFFA